MKIKKQCALKDSVHLHILTVPIREAGSRVISKTKKDLTVGITSGVNTPRPLFLFICLSVYLKHTHSVFKKFSAIGEMVCTTVYQSIWKPGN